MTERYLFFNSTMNDRRRHQASDMADYWMSFLSSGLIHQDGDPKLEVTANDTNRNINVDIGRAVIMGHLYINDDKLIHRIDDPDSLLDRIDRVVIRYDNSIENRFIKSFIIKGVEAENPEPPELTREGDIYELSLAQIHVKAGKSFIEQSDIIDERLDESVCGLASSLVTVPTDIFTAEWEEFVAEYNKWFAEIQDSSFATVGDVRESENNMKREIANLNLQIEANKRVKNGVTFGTNFADSFGMDIDMARTSSDDALSVGQKVITVRDAEDLKSGTEVTIFDDENLERVKIDSISGNDITLEHGLYNAYKEGVNVARTMSFINTLSRMMRFGAWGTYEYKEVNYYTSTRLQGEYRYPTHANFARVQDKFYVVVGKHIHQIRGSEATLVFETTYNTSLIASNSRGLFIIEQMSASTGKISFMNYDNEVLSVLSDIVGHPVAINLDDNNKILSVIYRGENNISDIKMIYREYSYDRNGALELIGEVQNIHKEFVPDRYLGLFDVKRVNGYRYFAVVSDASSDKAVINLCEVDDDFTELKKHRLLSDNAPGLSTAMYRMYTDDNETIKLVYLINSSIMEFTIDDPYGLIRGTYTADTDILISGLSTAIYMFVNLKGDVFYTDRIHLFSVDRESNSPIELYEYTEEQTKALSKPTFLPEYDFEGEIPFVFSINTGTMIYGKGSIGYGAEITTNDIRFKTKPSKEVVTWLQHDEGLTVTEATFGNINLDLSTINNETQAVGYTTKEQDEVRLTIERTSIDDDVKAYRILGGTS